MKDQEVFTLDVLWRVHSYLSDMSKFADAKLGVIVGFAAAFVAFLEPKVMVTQLSLTSCSPALVLKAVSILLFGGAMGFGL